MAGPEPEPVSSAAATTPAPSAAVVLPKTSESEQLLKIRHSMSHVMAMAVQQLFPKARTIGPWTETGFYYDFDNPDPFTEADLKAIKKGMIKIINKKLPLERVEVSRSEAKLKSSQNEPYKLEILEGLQEPITLYTLGEDWWDLCASPHVDHTGQLNAKAFELESVAGAYWRGDETKAQLQRIYGTAWETPNGLRTETPQGRGSTPRPSPDRQRPRPVLHRGRGRRRPGVLASPRSPDAPADRRVLAPSPLRGGYELLYTPMWPTSASGKTSGHLDFYSEACLAPWRWMSGSTSSSR